MIVSLDLVFEEDRRRKSQATRGFCDGADEKT